MDGFTKVKKKSRRKKLQEEYDSASPLYFAKLIKKVETILERFEDDAQLPATLCGLESALTLLGKERQDVTQIICYGLGSLTNSKSSLYQLALILKLSSRLNARSFFFDPIFEEVDVKLLEHLKCELLKEDFRGDQQVVGLTLFFLPHAPRFIFDNVLKSNWGSGLSNCLIFGDNLLTIVENSPSRVLKASQPYLFESSHFVDVVNVENKFIYSDVFNDFAFHVFVPSKLDAIDPSTWDYLQLCHEPE